MSELSEWLFGFLEIVRRIDCSWQRLELVLTAPGCCPQPPLAGVLPGPKSAVNEQMAAIAAMDAFLQARPPREELTAPVGVLLVEQVVRARLAVLDDVARDEFPEARTRVDAALRVVMDAAGDLLETG